VKIGQKFLMIISLLFMVTIAFSPFIYRANGWIAINIYVENESELRNAINAVPDNEAYAIVIFKDIVFEKSLEIPNAKKITLCGDVFLIGANAMDTIVVKSGGELSFYGNVVVTHADGDTGRGVYVERGGTFNLFNGVISGNSAVEGGGVYNEGFFNMWWKINAQDGVISGNSATKGGGVYNMDTFTLYGGHIRNNNCTDTSTSIGMGGGVYNKGTFNIITGCISDNVATKGGGLYNVGILESDGTKFFGQNVATSGEGHDIFTEATADVLPYLLPIVGVVVVIVVIAILLFYFNTKNIKRFNNMIRRIIK